MDLKEENADLWIKGVSMSSKLDAFASVILKMEFCRNKHVHHYTGHSAFEHRNSINHVKEINILIPYSDVVTCNKLMIFILFSEMSRSVATVSQNSKSVYHYTH